MSKAFAGKYFERDNFRSRRTTGHNLYDPESLLTGAEVAAGLDYGHPRQWPDSKTYDRAVSGQIAPERIPDIAPRRFSRG